MGWKIDWELRRFHGQEYSTHRGSSYNSYLVADKRTALIDTVWSRFSGEFVENLKKAGFHTFQFRQTLFHRIIEEIEETKEGFGEGSFVVVSALK